MAQNSGKFMQLVSGYVTGLLIVAVVLVVMRLLRHH